MKIVSLTSENIKRLTAVHIKPNGNLVEITGKNGQGKSSVLDSIWWAITGTGNIQAQPIRKGQERATIRLDLGEIVITRTFTRKDETDFTTSLSVRGADGSSFKSPQSVLDGLAGVLSFDPLWFARGKSKEQFDSLRAFVPGIDFEKVDAQNRGDFERRTEVNREAKRARAAADMIHVPTDTPEAPIDEKALTTEMQSAGTQNADIERRKGVRAQAVKDVEAWRARAHDSITAIVPRVEELRAIANKDLLEISEQIAALQRKADTVKQETELAMDVARTNFTAQADQFAREADELQARLDGAEQLPAVIDTAAIAKKLDEARVTNANVERARQKAVHVTTAKKYETEAEELSGKIEARNQAKRDAIAAAKMPVPGLDFGDGVVLLNGVPFEQASDAERLRASVAIAMASNPKLRVIRIRDGSLLDEDSMKILADMCAEQEFQCWVETVSSGDRPGFVLEDGHVRDNTATRQEAAA